MIPYLKVLIRQRIAAWNPVSYQSRKKSKTKGIVQWALIIVSMLMLYGMMVGLEYLLFGAFEQLGEPETMLALTGAMCTMMVVIMSFFYIFSELFFSKDIGFVSALPMSSREILTAKLLRIWLGEAGIALLICLPVAILYGVNQSLGVWYYARTLLLIPFLPMAPIAVVTLLSFALIRVSVLWKRREAMTVVMSMLFVTLFVWAEMKFSMSTQDDMGAAVLQMVLRRKHTLEMIAGFYPPIGWYGNALIGNGLAAAGNWIAFAGLGAAAIAAVVLLTGRSYQRLAIRQNETFTRMNAVAKKHVDRHGVRTPFAALYRREMREIFIVPVYAMNCLSSAVMFPLIAVIMILSAGQMGSELSALPEVLRLIPASLITVCAAGVFALTSTVNMAAATAVSREGVRHEFFRTLPVKPQTQLAAKLMMGLTLNLLTALPLVILMIVVLPGFTVEIVIGFLCSLLYSAATTSGALMIDVAHPKFGWKNETEAIKQNGIAAMSMFGSMAFVALCGAAFYGLHALGLRDTETLLLLCVLAVGIDALLLRRLNGKAAKTYILQEVEK